MNVSATPENIIETMPPFSMVWWVTPVDWLSVISLSPYFGFWGPQLNHSGVRTVGGCALFGGPRHIENMTKAKTLSPEECTWAHVVAVGAHGSHLLPDNRCLEQSWWTVMAAVPCIHGRAHSKTTLSLGLLRVSNKTYQCLSTQHEMPPSATFAWRLSPPPAPAHQLGWDFLGNCTAVWDFQPNPSFPFSLRIWKISILISF